MAEENNNFESHPNLPSGEWEGFYIQYAQKHKIDCIIEFSQNKISGRGSDSIACFTWKGSYDLDKEKCSMIKAYLEGHIVSYEGNVDENGIWGIWNINHNFKGGFHLWAKSSKTHEVNEEIEAISVLLNDKIII